MEETGWNGPDFNSLAEGPKPPEKNDKKAAKKARAKTSWAELVSKATDKENSERQGLFADNEKNPNNPRKPSLEASLLGIQKEEINTQRPDNYESQPAAESLDEVTTLSPDEKLEVVKQTSREGADAAVNEQLGLQSDDPNLAAAKAAEKFHEELGRQTRHDITVSLDVAEAQAMELIMQDIENEVHGDDEPETEVDYVEEDELNTSTPSTPPISPVSGPSSPSLPNRNFNNRRDFGEQSVHSHWPYVLTGGVVGYLIGRRRGRINAEDKLMPTQKALESEVQNLQWQISNREAKIRALAYESAKTKLVLVDAEPKAKSVPTIMNEQNIGVSNTETITPTEPLQQSKTPDRYKQEGEANNNEDLTNETGLDSTEPFIPILSLGADDSSKLRAEQAIESRFASETDRENHAETKDISIMSSNEIMQLAKSISIEGVDLWKMYKFGRLTESGLRMVVAAYLNGEDVDIKLHQNLQEYESIEQYPTLDDSYSDRSVQSSMVQQKGFPDKLDFQELPNEHLLNPELNKEMLTVVDSQVVVEETGVTESTDTDTQQLIIIGAIIGFCIAVAGILVYLLTG